MDALLMSDLEGKTMQGKKWSSGDKVIVMKYRLQPMLTSDLFLLFNVVVVVVVVSFVCC